MIDDFLKFVAETHKFNQIKRALYATGEDRWENDSEHSFQLAMCAWYLVQKGQFEINVDKVLKYALVHDLVELRAGDTFAYEKDKAYLQSKQEREAWAVVQLKTEFPELPDVHKFIAGYEAQEDKESRFVYALDKILPPANMILDGGRSWKHHGLTLDKVKAEKKEKVTASPEIEKLWGEFLVLLEERQEELFGDKS